MQLSPTVASCERTTAVQMLRKILSAGGDVCMRPICVVTNVDLADKAVGRALRKLPTSSRIKSIRAYISAQLGLNLNLVCCTAPPTDPPHA